ncbi:P-II family nitrogen regulator [Marinobacter sp.]|uniref:P-II family nitrogen regulator n=1 Tax=Marinobacter sp. TaxID=50741 RepID=UPI001B4C63A8|nr:P-II family nitrogen regulator [Marinobacter sp.]MBQ0832696.1 P-II family nitrogen regulator [Marinobacter sp.]
MYEIKAYVRETMAEHVIDGLAEVPGVTSIAVVPLSEFGHSTAGGGNHLAKVRMVKLEVDVADEASAWEVSSAIVEKARTQDGHPGDGKVLVSRLVRAIRIEDGVVDEEALSRPSS